ncbi:MAG: hypothetical protein IH994_01265 [Proteobacteria bacterium]|nr:hypothetical protein [Pseudomonadota bacterium]
MKTEEAVPRKWNREAKKLLSEPQWYFDTYVDPSYQDYMGDQLAQHKAANAMVAVFHFWERLYEYYAENESPHLSGIGNKEKFRDFLIEECPDLGVLRISANAIKHQVVNVPNGSQFTAVPQATVTGVTSNDRLTASSSSVTLATDSSVTHRTEERLIIEGTGRTVVDVLTSVMNFWIKWLSEERPEGLEVH